jgi:serine/threonine-protein kinase
MHDIEVILAQESVGWAMLVSEVAPYLSHKRARALEPALVHLPGTDRLPRYRVKVPPDAKDLLVGTTLAGKFYVLSVLGFGGMSVVYKAKLLGKARARIVAVKTLRMQGLSDELLVKRFQREAELLSHLNHPRIVQVHDYGYTKRGQPYFVMDYLVGQNLSTVIQTEGCVAVRRAWNIFNQVCGAVDHAHRCGVVHRDLKPGNIMLMSLAGEKDFVKVVDFGIARFEEEAQRLTRMGEVWGSPVYMSPEQCMGKQLDARSDIYSMGIVMYEALTGAVPFLGKRYVDTMSKQITEPPPPFKEAAPHLEIPSELEAVVMKALIKEPEHRYQTMSALREDLENAFPDVQQQRRKQERATNQRVSQQRLRASQTKLNVPGGKTADAPNLRHQISTLVLIGCLLAVLGYFGLRLLELCATQPAEPVPQNEVGTSPQAVAPEEHGQVRSDDVHAPAQTSPLPYFKEDSTTSTSTATTTGTTTTGTTQPDAFSNTISPEDTNADNK